MSRKITFMNRLFTFGCSHTRYNWHTYADFVALRYPIFQNWGFPGLGNRAIAERLAEAIISQNINENDTVIVQWSSHLRNDYAKTDVMNEHGNMWWTKGPVFADHNIKKYSKKWFKEFWDEKAYLIHSLNNIVLAINTLENIGCKWLMTMGPDLSTVQTSGEDWNTGSGTIDKFPADLIHYKKYIWETYKHKWLPPIMQKKKEWPDYDMWFKYEGKDSGNTEIFEVNGDRFKDHHMSPEQAYMYAEIVIEKLGLELELTETDIEIINFYLAANKQYPGWVDFIEFILSTPWALTQAKYGM